VPGTGLNNPITGVVVDDILVLYFGYDFNNRLTR